MSMNIAVSTKIDTNENIMNVQYLVRMMGRK
jgi:hypothetical protein